VIRLAVRVRREHAELVLAELLELAPSGVEESDVGEGVVEYAVYGSPGELPHLPDLRAAAGEALVEVATSELPDDWGERWKRFHQPVLIEAPGDLPDLHVRPPWEAAHNSADVQEIVIDPGQAFGTGAHATTRLCLELLLELTAERGAGRASGAGRGPLLDVGTGSGILAIAAAHLGYAPVLALDNDPQSVAAATANAAVNGASIEVSRFDLRRARLPLLGGAQPSIVLANLLLPLLLDLAHSIERPPADLIVGGLLAEQVDEVVGVCKERLHMHERARRAGGEWAAAWLTPDPAAR
jgi:ribosomal protein L11 methyltransferase